MPKNQERTVTKKKKKLPDKKKYIMHLYITGASPNSIRAINNLKQICDEYLKDNYSLEIVDVYQQKSVAEKEQIIALPLLIKRQPLPERRLIGDLSETDKVLRILGLKL